jgi:hypothetical protein
MDVVDTRRNELLEDTEQALDLVVGDDRRRPPAEERLPEPDERGNVAALLPKRGGEERAEEVLVRFGELGRRVKLEQLGEDLEDVGNELCVMGRKESARGEQWRERGAIS